LRAPDESGDAEADQKWPAKKRFKSPGQLAAILLAQPALALLHKPLNLRERLRLRNSVEMQHERSPINGVEFQGFFNVNVWDLCKRRQVSLSAFDVVAGAEAPMGVP
jgi:hypothetical protein